MENLKIKGRIWIETDTGLKIGWGRAKLLEQIHQSGNMVDAAKILNIPYRKAWQLVKEMNANSLTEIVTKEVGGKFGSKSVLTDYGKNILKQFKIAEESFAKFSLKEIKNTIEYDESSCFSRREKL